MADEKQPGRQRSKIRGWLPGPLPAAIAYVAENAVRLLLVAVVGVFVARYLGPEDLGFLGFAVSVFAVLIPISTLGMRQVLVREFSVAPDWRPLLVSSLTRQLPSATVVALVAAFVVMAARGFQRDAVLMAIALFPLPILALGDTLRALFESLRNVRRIVIAGLVAAIAASALKLVTIAMELPIWIFALAVSVEAGLVAIGLLWGRLGSGIVSSIRHHYSDSLASSLVSESWPLLVAAIAVTLYMKVDVLMLGLLSSDLETGLYVSAARLSEVWYFIPVAVAAAVRPVLSRIFADGDKTLYTTLTQRFITSSFLVAVLAAFVTVLVAHQVVAILYGADFSEAAPVLQLHVLAAPFVFIGVASSQWFIDNGLAKAVMVRSAVAAAVNIGLNVALIPPYGAVGAAIATLVSQALSGLVFNAFPLATRPLFVLQIRAFKGTWR